MPVPATSGQFRTRFEDMQVGDFIAYKAVGTSGVPCTISDIGAPLAIAQANEIPITGSAAPNGYAYAIKNDKGMCISDRPIQHSVSWDALNSAKLIQGKPRRTISLIHFNKDFTDNTGRKWVPIGNTVIDATKKVFGEGSLHVPAGNNATSGLKLDGPIDDFSFGSSDFTIRARILCNDPSLPVTYSILCLGGGYASWPYYGASNGHEYMFMVSGNKIHFYFGTNNNAFTSIVSPILTFDSGFNDVAVCRSGNMIFLILNGAIVASSPISGFMTKSTTGNLTARIGTTDGSDACEEVYIDEFEVLNYAKWTTNQPIATEQSKLSSWLVRSLTGGNSYLGTDGKMSLTDKGLGAFPVNNEWDKYIVGSNLGGKSATGDDNVWHWKNTSTMVQDTVVNGVRIDSINVTNTSSATRALRGNSSKELFGFPATDVNGSPRPSSTVGGDIAFRPVFQFLEPNSKASNLFY